MARSRSKFVRVRLSHRDRLTQIVQAHTDARRRLPDPRRDGAIGALTTPHLTHLVRQGEDTVEAVRGDAINTTAADQQELGRLRQHLTDLQNRITEITDDIAAGTPTPEQLAQRGAGEDRVEESVIVLRRRNEADRRLAPQRGELARLNQQRADTLEQMAVLEQRLAAVVHAAQSDAERFLSYVQARRELYLRTLSRRHPDGAAIAELARPELADLGWITTPDYHQVLSTKPARTPAGGGPAAAARNGDADVS